jgi:hypothetical protein
LPSRRKYSEVLRICRALAISPEQLTEGEAQTDIKARYLEMFGRLSRMQGEVYEIAHRLVPILVELAARLSVDRHHVEDFQAAGELVERAEGWIAKDWGESLNTMISLMLRKDPELEEIRPGYDARTYGEILKSVSELPWEPRSDEPGGGTDASET